MLWVEQTWDRCTLVACQVNWLVPLPAVIKTASVTVTESNYISSPREGVRRVLNRVGERSVIVYYSGEEINGHIWSTRSFLYC